jgi:hypothetical protein
MAPLEQIEDLWRGYGSDPWREVEGLIAQILFDLEESAYKRGRKDMCELAVEVASRDGFVKNRTIKAIKELYK